MLKNIHFRPKFTDSLNGWKSLYEEKINVYTAKLGKLVNWYQKPFLFCRAKLINVVVMKWKIAHLLTHHICITTFRRLSYNLRTPLMWGMPILNESFTIEMYMLAVCWFERWPERELDLCDVWIGTKDDMHIFVWCMCMCPCFVAELHGIRGMIDVRLCLKYFFNSLCQRCNGHRLLIFVNSSWVMHIKDSRLAMGNTNTKHENHRSCRHQAC